MKLHIDLSDALTLRMLVICNSTVRHERTFRLACCMISPAKLDEVEDYYRIELIHNICRLVPPAKPMLSQ